MENKLVKQTLVVKTLGSKVLISYSDEHGAHEAFLLNDEQATAFAAAIHAAAGGHKIDYSLDI